MELITIKDYARANRISYEAVRKQIKRYKEDLAPFLFREGKQTFLTTEAVAFLDERRRGNPISVVTVDKNEYIDELEERVDALQAKLIKLHEEYDSYVRDTTARLADAAEATHLLAASNEDRARLEGELTDARTAIMHLNSEFEASKASEKRLEADLRVKRQKGDELYQESQTALKNAQKASERVVELEGELNRPLTWLERLTGKRKST